MSNIREHIIYRLKQTTKRNEVSSKDYQQRLLGQLNTNLQTAIGNGRDAKLAIKDNAGLVSRIKAVKPYPMNQMQQAFDLSVRAMTREQQRNAIA